MTNKITAAIIGSGNIGTDLMMKMVKYPQNMELAAVVGIDTIVDVALDVLKVEATGIGA
jgi:acetaldehyde dehydrogenase (acetylating)